jgi:plastocyanin
VTVNGCDDSAFDINDYTGEGASRTINFPTGPAPAQYDIPCMKIKAGQSVTWSGAFENHPLEPAGGSAGSPITLTDTGTEKSFTFPNPGTYGYDCEFHPGDMFGAIRVVP